jgi:hypothetical protein
MLAQLGASIGQLGCLLLYLCSPQSGAHSRCEGEKYRGEGVKV